MHVDDAVGESADWSAFMSSLPPLGKDEESKRKMEEWFDKFDNGNGYLSLAELDRGILQYIEIPGKLKVPKPVILRAFQASKDAHKSQGKESKGDDYVERSEFRLLLVWIRQYYELWQMFGLIDSNEDRRIDFQEFSSALPKLKAWGLSTDDPKASFEECDQSGGGLLLFDEFAAWALKKRFDSQEDDFDDEDSGTTIGVNPKARHLKGLPPPVQPSTWGAHNSKANRLPSLKSSRPSRDKPGGGAVVKPAWKRLSVSDFTGGPSILDFKLRGRSKDDLDKPAAGRVVLPPIHRSSLPN